MRSSLWERIASLSELIAESIFLEQGSSFFLPALLRLFDEVKREYNVEGLSLASFERWLFLDSGYSEKKQKQIRGQIAGKYVPNSAFQKFFPVGMRKNYPGPHIVCAHAAPDTDTIVSSFWGWLDAFALGISASGRHIWFVPGGPPDGNVEVELLFYKILGINALSGLARTSTNFVLTACDLIDISYFADLNKLEGREIGTVSEDTPWEDLYLQAKSASDCPGWFRVLYKDSLLGFCSSGQILRDAPGTLSLRDFSNPEEGNVPSYLELLSVVDHHKSFIKSSQVNAIHVQDFQSTNAILADMQFQVNDLYGCKGLSLEEITQMEINSSLTEIEKNSIKVQLLQIQSAILRRQKEDYFISSCREWLEAVFFLYAIFDDTDLLIKVSQGDLILIAQLLNRLFSFHQGWSNILFNVESFRDTAISLQDKTSILLQNEFVYNFYKEIYAEKEKLLNISLLEGGEGSKLSLFDDTKIQNQYSRVGQCKLYPNNYAVYENQTVNLKRHWITQAENFWKKQDLRFHIQMISWLPDAGALFSGNHSISGSLKDELWIWTPDVPKIQHYLVLFLEKLRQSSPLKGASLDLFLSEEDKNSPQDAIVSALSPDTCSYLPIKKGGIVLRFPPLLMHSRKASISPFLPRVSE